MVRRDSRFDAHERDRLLAYLEHEDQTCAGCGVHPDIVEADDLTLTPRERYCAACQVSEQFQRMLAAGDEQAEKALAGEPAGTKRPGDGRRVALELTASDPHPKPDPEKRR